MIARYRKYILLAVTAALLLAPGLSRAAGVGSFTRVEGSVDVLHPGATAAVPVRTGDAVSMGDAVRTKRNSKAEIQFSDESVVQLAPETRITIDEYSFRSSGSRERGIIGLLRGKVRAIVSRLKATVIPVSDSDSSFNIKTPTAVAGVKGTDFIVYYERGVSGIIFINGLGFVFNPDHPDRIVPIHAGQATFVPAATAAPTAPVTVSESYVAPHMHDTTTAITGGSGESTTSAADVVSVNTTYAALTSSGLADEAARVVLLSTTQPVTQTQSPPPTPPVTTTHPELLGTQVTVRVHIP